jgi:beta-barrel assembly-enhancing protease
MLQALTLAFVLQTAPAGKIFECLHSDHLSHHRECGKEFEEFLAFKRSQEGESQDDKKQDDKRTDAQKKADEKAEKDRLRFEEEVANDKKMGKEAADYYDKQYKPTKNLESQRRVEEIGERLAITANANPYPVLWGDKRHAEFDYKFKVVDSADINAFSLPGGYIYVFQGLVDFAQSDEELAGVLAHEICHASQRHVATLQREQSRMSSIQIPLILAGILTGGATSAIMATSAGSLVTTAMTSGWSIKAETSADKGGYELMVATGYDATGMLTFMERLQVQLSMPERAMDLGIYRTHPPSKERADKIERYMRDDLIPIRRSKVTLEFRVHSKDDEQGKLALYFGRRKLMNVGGENPKERAKDFAKKLNDFLDVVPEMFEVTTGENGIIFGKNRTLIKLSEADAAANSMNLEKLQTDVAKALRSSIFSLAYHIWDSRGG